MSVELGDISLTANVLIVRNHSLKDLLNWAMIQGFTEFSVAKDEGLFQLSHPLTVDERIEYKWLYHKMARLSKPDDEPPKGGGPKGDGPKGGPGGSPASGSVAEYQDTVAVAV